MRFVCTIAAIIFFSGMNNINAQDKTGIKALLEDSTLKQGEVIAFFGDSLTQSGAKPGGYCRLISESVEKQKADLDVGFVFAGISGNKVPDLQKRVDKDILSRKPSLVFIYIGINDVWHSLRDKGTPIEKFESGLRDLVQKISNSGATIVLCTPSTIGEKTDGTNRLDSMLEDYAAVSREIANEFDLTLCDLRKSFINYLKENNPDNKERDVLTYDGVHLNATGNRFVADRAAEAIAQALKKRNSSKKTSEKTTKLFNGSDLNGWQADVPNGTTDSFIVRDGKLVSLGEPQGHLLTENVYQNYRLDIEYRFPGDPGNCGVLVHASKLRALYKMFPQSIEVQMNHEHAGDFWCIAEDITVPDMERRRGAKNNWGIVEGKARRIVNLTDDSEKPLGQWNAMTIECVGDQIKVWVNGDMVNHGSNCTASSGKIAIQAEGAEAEFRKFEMTPIEKLTSNDS